MEDVGQAAYHVHRNAHQGKVGVLTLAPEEGLGVRDPEKRARFETHPDQQLPRLVITTHGIRPLGRRLAGITSLTPTRNGGAMVSRRVRNTQPELGARLRCGIVLTYETSSFLPEVGECIPSVRHGYCEVTARERVHRRRPGVRHVPPPRSTDELVDFLSRRPITTVRILRSHRFTLRVVVTAQREGRARPICSAVASLCEPGMPGRGGTDDQRRD